MAKPVANSSPTRPALEVADIFRAHGAEYLQTHRVTEGQRKVIRAILQCRTAALGGHVEECNNCGAQRIAYNSCRNRHCPKCQWLEQARWVEQQVADLLPIEYYHVIFTLPQELNELARWQPRLVYDLLFEAASKTLLKFGQQELGGELGITAVLHTWGQTLQTHIHLHCLVTGGALAADGQSFRRCRQGFLCSVEELSAVYRAHYCAGLRRWAQQAANSGAPMEAQWAAQAGRLAGALSERAWVVYAKRPHCGPGQVIEYLSRYTQRVASSNARLLDLSEGVVSFRYKDYRAGGVNQVMRLPASEFIRRFLQHVLPAGYVRIRHYGLLASRERGRKLARCRELLRTAPVGQVVQQAAKAELLRGLSARELKRCEECGSSELVRVAQWQGGESPPLKLGQGERRMA